MRKEYEKPVVEIIDFSVEDAIMNGDLDLGGDDLFMSGGAEEW